MAMSVAGVVVAACSASTRELPAEMFAMPASSGPIVMAVDAGGLGDGGRGTGVASARKKKDVLESAQTACPAHVRAISIDGGVNDFIVPANMWSALRNEMYKSTFAPHTDATGNVDGFTVANVGPCFAELGLDDNDLLRNVNGIELDDGGAYMRVWESIQQQGSAVVHLERGGLLVELRYKVQQ